MEASTFDPRLAGTRKALGESLMKNVINSRILVVGAGGIGCELLKNLVLTGFTNIETIDLDTIDTSNLNRQFLFHKPDVGKSKSLTASVSCKKYNPNVNITAYFANVKDTQFGPSYVKGFDLVMNALDNLSARRHVNRVCMAAGVPLIESGTSGYLGQVQVIKSGISECFECVPQEPPKTFPVCTIRLNPSTPVHCIVWAQSIYKRFFGEKVEGEENQDEDELPKDETEDNRPLTEEERKEKATLQKMYDDDKTKLGEEKNRSFARWLFHKLFHSEVLYLSTLTHLWVDKTPPNPLFLNENALELNEKLNKVSPFFEAYVNNAVIPDQRVWGPMENSIKFLEAAQELYNSGAREKWEKDNQIHLDFVTAAANLRACVFHLDLSSRFYVKEQAGNIIPAIATTNAITAGLIVMKALRILDNKLETCSNTYLRKQPYPGRGILLVPSNLDLPSPACYVCSKHMLTVVVNTNTMKIRSLVEEIIKKQIKVTEPIIGLGNVIIFDDGIDRDDEEEVEANEKQLAKLLIEKQIVHNVILDLTDGETSAKIDLTIFHDDSKNENEFQIIGQIPDIVAEEEKAQATIKAKEEKEREANMEMEVEKSKKLASSNGVIDIGDEDDDLMIISPTPVVQEESNKKRKAEDDLGAGLESKKAKAS
jgi:ubiquitin-like 1-activating enzyme E1 B